MTTDYGPKEPMGTDMVTPSYSSSSSFSSSIIYPFEYEDDHDDEDDCGSLSES